MMDYFEFSTPRIIALFFTATN